MDWYTKRKVIISGVFAVVILMVLGFFLNSLLSKPATCNDGKQNGLELGVDCGGGCLLVCLSEYKPLSVSLAKAIKTSKGVYDILVIIDNPNQKMAPKMLNVVVDLYDASGKKFKTLRSSSPAFTGLQTPTFNQNFQADDISNVVARLEPYDMYRSDGGYSMQMKKFSFVKKDNTTDLDIFYTSPYKEDITDSFSTMVIVYNSLGNVVGFTQTNINGLEANKTNEVFVSLPYRVEGDIASVKFLPLNAFYAKE